MIYILTCSIEYDTYHEDDIHMVLINDLSLLLMLSNVSYIVKFHVCKYYWHLKKNAFIQKKKNPDNTFHLLYMKKKKHVMYL